MGGDIKTTFTRTSSCIVQFLPHPGSLPSSVYGPGQATMMMRVINTVTIIVVRYNAQHYIISASLLLCLQLILETTPRGMGMDNYLSRAVPLYPALGSRRSAVGATGIRVAEQITASAAPQPLRRLSLISSEPRDDTTAHMVETNRRTPAAHPLP